MFDVYEDRKGEESEKGERDEYDCTIGTSGCYQLSIFTIKLSNTTVVRPFFFFYTFPRLCNTIHKTTETVFRLDV